MSRRVPTFGPLLPTISNSIKEKGVRNLHASVDKNGLNPVVEAPRALLVPETLCVLHLPILMMIKKTTWFLPNHIYHNLCIIYTP
jgi:hypothetical protein